MRDNESLRRSVGRGELVRLVYRLGRQHASGVLTITARFSAVGSSTTPTRASEVFVLRRGQAMVGEGELAKRTLVARLARLVGQEAVVVFEGGVSGLLPPGATHGVSLATWARAHVEQQLDSSLADTLMRELAGIRLTLRSELSPEPQDEADRRMLVAMAQPRRLDQIWPLARTPRFRLLAFVHFLRTVDALEVEGVAAERSAPVRTHDPRRSAALRLLGVDDGADLDAVKRAYRRLARSLHPDLQPEADGARRRVLERRFAEVTAAYEALS